MSNMGARVARALRSFNLENRVYREISKEKPSAAPRHKVNVPEPVSSSAEDPVSIHQRNDPLLSFLKTVYVESTDPLPSEAPKQVAVQKEEERRPLKFTLPVNRYGLVEITDVPKGKLSLVEALKALNSHKREPKAWTAEKIAEEYSLDLKDTKALVEFFIPFNITILPPNTDRGKQIKGS
ncbi:NADH dehydrogenase [ubiquinone] 1 alpha subcomplex assembly factor 4 [Lampris incognitus]|uniref:NADH dehydrogenase [ubiquinone] 1 alpha subcomplex assembly factor 4 n=1 Tax=Lampris incognitus TaxID=2546036 RepID=UPI0024B4F55D|nr:NADH dehydrogenase [ubiquinone] 1 alpha subcomplex assembly factor 4 [Lampris incognitus]